MSSFLHILTVSSLNSHMLFPLFLNIFSLYTISSFSPLLRHFSRHPEITLALRPIRRLRLKVFIVWSRGRRARECFGALAVAEMTVRSYSHLFLLFHASVAFLSSTFLFPCVLLSFLQFSHPLVHLLHHIIFLTFSSITSLTNTNPRTGSLLNSTSPAAHNQP